MNLHKLLIILMWLLQATLSYADESFPQRMEGLALKKQDLAMRALLHGHKLKKISRRDWLKVRTALHSRPGVGYDILVHWDRLAPERWIPGQSQKVVSGLQNGKDLLEKQQPKEAVKAFRKVAEQFNAEEIRIKNPNFFIYQEVLHNLARALYGAKQYEDSLKVYGWISVLYPYFRQVQFEKMWAGFQAQRPEMALGAITSQRSSYFSTYMQPESYLIQYYLNNRLCRQDDLNKIRAEVDRYDKDISNGNYNVEKWVRQDVETMALWHLLQQKDSAIDALGNTRMVNAEIEWIQKHLKNRFERDLPNIKAQLKRVQSYLAVASPRKTASLPKVTEMPGMKKIVDSDNEMWPVDTGEDWLDELGHHVFLGQSQCQKDAT